MSLLVCICLWHHSFTTICHSFRNIFIMQALIGQCIKPKSLYLIRPCTFLVRNFSDFIWYIPLFNSHISMFLIYYFLLCSFYPLRSLTLLLQFHFQNIVPSFGLLHFVESLIWSTFMQIQFWLLMKWLVYWFFLLLLPYLFLPSFLL